jgi:hypothetical protein
VNSKVVDAAIEDDFRPRLSLLVHLVGPPGDDLAN